MNQQQLEALCARLRASPGVRQKQDIQKPAHAFGGVTRAPNGQPVVNGDDAAALRDGDEFLLLAAEGMLPAFVQADPWFAGFCSVMVNLSDIAAMGGRPLAVVDVLFAGSQEHTERLLGGMRDASEAFGVPVVGGHTSRNAGDASLAVAVMGKAKRLLSSFAAKPGDELVVAVDLRGTYRGHTDNFNAATCASSEALKLQLALLPEVAEQGLATACKDISMAGLLGTLTMLCESSNVGASLDLTRLPAPPNVELERWLRSFPSYGYLLATQSDQSVALCRHFEQAGVSAEVVGRFSKDRRVRVRHHDAEATFWRTDYQPLTGFGARVEPEADPQPAQPQRADRHAAVEVERLPSAGPSAAQARQAGASW